MFGHENVLWCVLLSWVGLGLSALITTQGHFGVTDKNYDNFAVGYPGSNYRSTLSSIYLPAGMSEQQALLWCLYKCVETPYCHSFVVDKGLTYCSLTGYDTCVDHSSQLYGVPGVRTYDVRIGSLPKPIRTCYSSCTGSCAYCGRMNCKGVNCDTCAHFCWDPQVYNITDSVLLWPDLALYMSIFYSCDKGWQNIWEYNEVSHVATSYAYPLLFTGPTTLRLAVIYNYTTILYSYFNNFTFAGNMISVGSYLGGKAGNYWKAPFENQSLIFNASCPFFYPASNINCNLTAVSNSSITWLSGFSAFDANVTATNINVTKVQFWVIPKGMEWLKLGY
nr:uncharacterized protein LOC123774718 [Procambarus clarkii]XP_045625210.1 uncharacterized protein LOC123774718 [Procambarus clarkii]XP_045625220.1 uncharacterized protein LOC123774718 [Procambarus clarkii]XP_045625230.1 uncharacterized protein LOC123774718 [Procambarus clarkii]